MSPLLDIAPGISLDQTVYRTLDFYSAASIVTNRKLMFSRADTFIDKNEGIDRLLVQLELSHPNSGCGMGWTDSKSAQREHERVKRSHFISCWTRTAESVAMWSLYSADLSSVRISTRLSKLQPVVETLLEKYSITRLTKADLDTSVVVAVEGRIAPVTYASLLYISNKVSRRAKARIRLAKRYARHGRTMPLPNEVDPRYWQREEQRQFDELRTTCSLKDSSFEHEGEIRLAIRLGEEVCRESVFKEQAFADPKHEYHSIFGRNLKAWSFIHSVDLPEREFVDCPADLIESVAVDPRCPPHKAAFIKNWFKDQGVHVVNSDCFGYLPDSFSVYPDA